MTSNKLNRIAWLPELAGYWRFNKLFIGCLCLIGKIVDFIDYLICFVHISPLQSGHRTAPVTIYFRDVTTTHPLARK